MIDHYVSVWSLIPDGDLITTATSRLLPVRYENTPAMLKVVSTTEERRGNHLMAWWKGDGAAPVLKQEGDAILMERANNSVSLKQIARLNDDSATTILVTVANQLHRTSHATTIDLLPLSHWFRELVLAGQHDDGLLFEAATMATMLLNSSQDEVVLHGDLHHENVLHFDKRGWLAIDPKALYGERSFDFANIFCNPDLEIATRPGRLQQQATLIAKIANIDKKRLLQWVLAYAGLSAAWLLNHSSDATLPLAIAKLALAELQE